LDFQANAHRANGGIPHEVTAKADRANGSPRLAETNIVKSTATRNSGTTRTTRPRTRAASTNQTTTITSRLSFRLRIPKHEAILVALAALPVAKADGRGSPRLKAYA